MAQVRYSQSPFPPNFLSPHPPFRHLLPPTLPKLSLLHNTSLIISQSASPIQFVSPTSTDFRHHIPFASGGDAGGGSSSGGGAGRGGSDDNRDDHPDHGSGSSSSSAGDFGPIGAFLEGWRSRVAADPQFPFKVLMEELVGVTACVIGDMASRPNFGLNELDFVFSTLVVGSILNFVLMYLLAPTAGPAGAAAAVQSSLPSIFAGCPHSHMFEPGSYGLLSRLGTFVYKGTLFAAVGFAAGLVGTALSNGLITMRKKMDPNFETPNKPPPTVLNAFTWALHMGISSNLRYQSLNGIEFLLEKGLPPLVFKSSVVVLRCLNNLLGGMSFVVLARLTGSQAQAQAQESPAPAFVTDQPKEAALTADEKQNLINHAEPESATSK